MKLYEGEPYRRLSGGFSVRVINDYGGPEGTTYELPHYVRHSPDGFAWGYGGSGPSELARCLLIDVLGVEDMRVEGLYQRFKTDVVSQWPMDEPWRINDVEIRNWVEMRAWPQEATNDPALD